MLAGDGRAQENCRTFVFKGETHTLGNALKNVILQNPQVVFCGYSMPHPAEDQVTPLPPVIFSKPKMLN
jgi:DNA-directed RNA polymerase I and III subunit RPAC2